MPAVYFIFSLKTVPTQHPVPVPVPVQYKRNSFHVCMGYSSSSLSLYHEKEREGFNKIKKRKKKVA